MLRPFWGRAQINGRNDSETMRIFKQIFNFEQGIFENLVYKSKASVSPYATTYNHSWFKSLEESSIKKIGSGNREIINSQFVLKIEDFEPYSGLFAPNLSPTFAEP